MTNDLERVTKLAEECGCFTIGIPADIHSTMVYQFTKEQLLAFEQAVLAKRNEEHDSLVGQLELEIERLKTENELFRVAMDTKNCVGYLDSDGHFLKSYVQGSFPVYKGNPQLDRRNGDWHWKPNPIPEPERDWPMLEGKQVKKGDRLWLKKNGVQWVEATYFNGKGFGGFELSELSFKEEFQP